MNNTQPPRLTLSSQLKRSIVAGVISALIYGTLAGVFVPLSSAKADLSVTYDLWFVALVLATYLLFVLLSIPGMAVQLGARVIRGASVINPQSAAYGGMLPAAVITLVLWFFLGAISGFAFGKSTLAIVMWFDLVGITELLGLIVFFFLALPYA